MMMTREQLDSFAAWIRAEALAAVAAEKGSGYTYAFEDLAKAARSKIEEFLLESAPQEDPQDPEPRLTATGILSRAYPWRK